MAYTPISSGQKKGGYKKIGTTPVASKPQPQTYQELFPATQMVSGATFDIRQKPVLSPTKPTIISQGKPEEISPIRKAVRAIPGDSRFEKSLERDVLDPLAKVGKFFAPSTSDIMRQIAAEKPGISNEELQKELQKRVTQSGIPLNKPGTPITSDTKVFSPDIVGMVKKIPGKLAQRFIGAKTTDEALELARGLGIKNPAKSVLDDIIKVSDDVSAQSFIDDLKAQNIIKPSAESLPPLPKAPAQKPVTSIAAKADDVPTPTAPVRTAQVAKATPETKVSPETLSNSPDPVGEFSVARGLNDVEVQDSLNALRQWISSGARGQVDQKTLNSIDSINLKPAKPVTLYRIGDVDDSQFQSWSKIKPTRGEVFTEKTFTPDEVLVDTTIPELQILYRDDPDALRVLQNFNRTEGEVVIKPKSMVSKAPELPPLPKLAPEMRQAIERGQADTTVTKALQERYRSAARRPEVQDNELAAAAKSDKSPSDIVKVTGKLLTPISSRLRRINPELETSLRKFEYDAAQSTYQGLEEIRPLLKATQKMTKEEQSLFNLARLNGDEEVIDALATKYNIQDEVNKARDVLDDLFTRGNEAGMDIPYRKGYFPRVVKNPKAYLNYWRGRDDWGDINRLIEEEAKKKNINYFDLMKDEEKVTSIINNYIRGYGSKTVLAAPSFAKGRTIAVLDDELAEFYESADSALATYVVRMNDEIAARKYFGKKADGDADISETIGAHVMKLVAEGKIKPQQQEEVAEILRSRFHRGKMYGAIDVFRNTEYLSTMGNPISAITQIGDFAWTLYENGFYKSAKALAGKKKITRESLGFDMAVMNEFTKDSMTGAAVDKVFKAVGLDKMARLGQETFVNANFAKFQQQAKNNSDELKMQLDRMFDSEESALAFKEFAEGKITDRTRFVVFNRLLDFQPLTKSEMPEVYLNNPNGRIFYMLKSFTLKQYDLYRRESFDLIATGERAQVAKGMKNLMSLAALFVMANATADEIKDLITGRETTPSDRLIDNLYRLVGASKFDIYQAREDGLGTAIVKKILFPVSVVDRLSKDIENTVTDKRYEKGPMAGEKYKFESTQTIPVGGKLYYWWFGRGAQKEEYKATKGTGSQSSSALPAMPQTPELPPLPKLPKLPSV